ncbi:asparagine synthase-related protein [Flagellimonas sp.]|uniref:asparagine synthase-related protein n=1 Tax=Flagellimonas sp. TaxID=2058762 RepID=UPI003AB8CFC0
MKNVRIGATLFPWEQGEVFGRRVISAGTCRALSEIIAAANAENWQQLAKLLRAERNSFGLIFETASHVIAVCDRIRGYPLFLKDTFDVIEVSSTVGDWLTEDLAGSFDERQAKLFLAAGYTIGDKTLSQEVTKVLAGQFIFISKSCGKVLKQQYSFFQPRFDGGEKVDAYWDDRLDHILSSVAERTIEQANGNTIWVPLSGGFDSRAVLAMILEKGYDNVQTFSYGNQGNTEAEVAKGIAEKANVAWRFIHSLPNNPRDEFRSKSVTEYFLSHGGLGYAPAVAEYFPLKNLLETGEFSEGDYLVNGQSGDFLTGGHIPDVADCNQLIKYIWTKHFGLLPYDSDPATEDDVELVLGAWIKTYLGVSIDSLNCQQNILKAYLAFECQERQCQYVVQQQRAYDHFQMNWALPLWDGELMDLFEEVPVSQQTGQQLYLRLLRKKNFRGMFEEGRRPIDPWPVCGSVIRFAARSFGLMGGDRQRAYKRMYYWSDRNYIYQLFGQKVYRNLYQQMRGSISLVTLDYLNRIRSTIGVPPRTDLEKIYAHNVMPLDEK